ncbi:lysyl oxidase homolog 2B-like [Lytechinus variegatus]|uniref:lysyl oxidase homolog 2B-like n=1 Tax=Lytechinus variegatus TaxID=7654 RepID=UPI001BB1DD02|nr:lysyl oxidase homolog 2B-like [Lytechinus variegatus]
MESSYIFSRHWALLLTVCWLFVHECSAVKDSGSVLDPSTLSPMDRDVRLKGGAQPWEGRIEIYSQSSGDWHTHCNTPRREEFYHVVCRRLGYNGFLRDLKATEFEKSSLVPLRGYFECNKDSADLRSCFFKEGDGCGSNEEEVGIVCSAVVQSCGPISFQRDDHREMHPFRLSYPDKTRVNVRCPGDPSISGVMKCVNGHWEWEGEEPPACPPRADDTITCPAPFYDTRHTFLLPAKLTYRYDETFEIVCIDRSDATKLRCGDGGRLECYDGGDGCIPEAPSCVTPFRRPTDDHLLLVGGDKSTKGRVLVNRDGQWGSICADGWNLANANVICAELGYGPARRLLDSPKFPPGPKRYLFREVRCSSSDTNILGCSMKHMSVGDKCHSDYEAEVDCFPEEPQSYSFRSNCGTPGLPQNTFVKPYKHVYNAGEMVTLFCGGKPTKKVELTCSSDGLWSGDVIDCGVHAPLDPRLLIGIGIGIIFLQIVISIIISRCSTPRQQPVAEVRDDAPPPDNEAKARPTNQQSVQPLRHPQSDDSKQE